MDETTATPTIAERTTAAADAVVAAGVALLDRYFGKPGNAEPDTTWDDWRARVDRDLLRINSMTVCPLAQAFGEDFPFGAQALEDDGMLTEEEIDSGDWAPTYGFDAGFAHGPKVHLDYSDLEAAWRRALPAAEPADTTTTT